MKLSPQQATQRNQIIAQKFNEQYPKLLQTRLYPQNKLPALWLHHAQKALRFFSPFTLGITPKNYAELINLKDGGPMTMLQFADLNNTLDKASADQMGMGLEEYGEMITAYQDLGGDWNFMVKDLRDELEKKLISEQDLLETIGYDKPIKAEA